MQRWKQAGWLALMMATAMLQGQAQGAKPKVVLVELFTSEGCSDCPPADALLRKINGSQTATGQLIVGLSEHVTYWNRLGWADPFSQETFTDRQNGYGESLRLESVYTPQMVVNGREQFVGSDRNSLERALLREQAQPATVDVRIASATEQGNALQVSFAVAGGRQANGADLFAVVTDDLDQSNVLRGENSGRSLTHVAVARSFAKIGKVTGDAQQTVQVPLPASFHGTHGHHIVIFAQAAGQGAVLGADSLALQN